MKMYAQILQEKYKSFKNKQLDIINQPKNFKLFMNEEENLSIINDIIFIFKTSYL